MTQPNDGGTEKPGTTVLAAGGRWVTVAGALSLAILGAAGNYFVLPLFFGSDLIFGSIATFVAIRLFGGIIGVLVAIPGALSTIALWGLPGPPFVLMAEALFVALTYRKLQYLAIADALFWLLLGSALVGIVVGISNGNFQLVVLKQLANGVLNASIATVIVMCVTLFVKRRPVSYLEAAFTIIVLVNVLPTLVLVSNEMRRDKTRMEISVGDELRTVLSLAEIAIENAQDNLPAVVAPAVQAMALQAAMERVPRDQNISIQYLTSDGRTLSEIGNPILLSSATMLNVTPELDIWLPERGDMPLRDWYKIGKYVAYRDMSELIPGSRLVSTFDTRTVIEQLELVNAKRLLVVDALLILTILLAALGMYLLARPLDQLGRAADQVAGDVKNRNLIDIPSSAFLETNRLADRLREMANALLVSYRVVAEAKDEAVALSIAKGKYVSTVSHEIRTPLNAVIGMTSVIRRLPMDRRLQAGMLTIETAAKQMLTIVNNALDIERIEFGAMQLQINNFDVQRLVAQVIQVVSALPKAGSLDVVSSVDAEVPRFLLGNQERIAQILLNLMSNAVKFTERGSVRLRVSSQAEGPNRVCVRFEVQDTGKGIPQSMHEKVFEPFAQVSTESGSTGLGLTLCREFATRMGGDLTLESSEFAGSTFTFSLSLPRGLPQPDDEAQRLSALHELEILDSKPEPAFDELVAEAACACEVPIALVSLVDEHRQWIKAKFGLEASQTPREHGFCAHAILTPERLMVVPDTRADQRFSANALVTGAPGIRFYAAAPLVDSRGHALGTLCVLDRVPRELSAAQLAELKRLAGKVTALLTADPARSLRVLVAEDTPASQLVIRLILEQQGHSVRVVDDGKKAVSAFAEEPFDLVLLDIQMPVMDGLEAARALRLHARGGLDLQIVGLSAYATQKDRENAIESGMSSYLLKPVRASDIATLIAQLKVRPTTSSESSVRQGAADGDTVDEAALHQLLDNLGPEALAATLAQFELDARADLERLRSRAAADDREPVRMAAHRLNGLFSQFGASAAARYAAELEHAPDALQSQAANRLIELGPDAIAAVRAVANQMLAAEVTSLPQS